MGNFLRNFMQKFIAVSIIVLIFILLLKGMEQSNPFYDLAPLPFEGYELNGRIYL